MVIKRSIVAQLAQRSVIREVADCKEAASVVLKILALSGELHCFAYCERHGLERYVATEEATPRQESNAPRG